METSVVLLHEHRVGELAGFVLGLDVPAAVVVESYLAIDPQLNLAEYAAVDSEGTG